MRRFPLPVPLLAVIFGAVILGACTHHGGAPAAQPTAALPARDAPSPAPNLIDDLIHEQWRAAGLTPSPAADDAEWLRRVTLDLAGRVPTAAEARAFTSAATTDGAARGQVVDRLLASADYAEHQADVYGDLLLGRDFRVRAGKKRAGLVAAPRAWLVTAFQENRPWDQMASALISAEGDLADDGAVAYVAVHGAKGGGPEVLAGRTARDFLGISIQCAQCHDHPYEPSVHQEDFQAFAAYFARTAARPKKNDDGTRSLVVLDVKNRRQERRLAAYRKKQGQTEITADPRFLGRDVAARDGESRRQTLARAVVGSDLFAKAAVNRTWQNLFGRAVVEPWDDLGREDDDTHPPLLEALAADFRANGHDLRHLLRVIVLSDAYARGSRGGADDDPQLEAQFARAAVRPLGADQLFRSLLVATGIESVGRGRFREQVEDGKERALREYLFVFGDDEMSEADGFQGSVTQALLLWNGEVTNLGTLAADGSVLGDILAASDEPATRLEAMFLAAYGRAPSATEQTKYGAYLADRRDAKQAYEDLYFALLTSTEFLTNH